MDMAKLKKTITIQRSVQVFLLILLVLVAFQFQQKMTQQQFLRAALFTIALQLLLFYPLNKLGEREASREVNAAAPNLPADKLAAARRSRIVSDMVRGAFFLFFITFIVLAPNHPSIQAIIFFTFIFTYLAFIQCFIGHLKRKMQAP
jgi:hypothetical protein